MIFVTIGSFAPFDRLVEAVDALAADHPDEEWFAQIGEGSYLPRHMEYARYVDKQEFDERIRTADALIGHAGMGTISGALAARKPLIVMPRDNARGEHVDTHQFETADLFENGGHVLVAREAGELVALWPQLATFDPKPRVPTPEAVGARVGTFLQALVDERRAR